MKKLVCFAYALLLLAGCAVGAPKPEKGRSYDCEFTVSGRLQGTFACEVAQYLESNGQKRSFNLMNTYSGDVDYPGGMVSRSRRLIKLTMPVNATGEIPITDFDQAYRGVGSAVGALFGDYPATGNRTLDAQVKKEFSGKMKGRLTLVSRVPYLVNFEFTSEGESGKVSVKGRFRVE